MMPDNDLEANVEIHVNPALFIEVLGMADKMEICENFVVFRGENMTCWISKVVPI